MDNQISALNLKTLDTWLWAGREEEIERNRVYSKVTNEFIKVYVHAFYMY